MCNVCAIVWHVFFVIVFSVIFFVVIVFVVVKVTLCVQILKGSTDDQLTN